VVIFLKAAPFLLAQVNKAAMFPAGVRHDFSPSLGLASGGDPVCMDAAIGLESPLKLGLTLRGRLVRSDARLPGAGGDAGLGEFKKMSRQPMTSTMMTLTLRVLETTISDRGQLNNS